MADKRQHSPLIAILLGGVVAGTVDIGAACLINGRDPIFICQIIAGGLLGRESLHGGMNTAVLGLVLQWAMGIIIAAIFVTASRAIPFLARRWLLSGLAYGVGIYFVMNLVVVPLSRIGGKGYHFVPVRFAEDMVAMLVFGVIVAWFARSDHQALAEAAFQG
ncbi:MAG TPA: hypothetical protein VKB71_11505 [Rhizomicrobium sp.]|nr:hypothetical protein [Rhizomicrobium sp.]